MSHQRILIVRPTAIGDIVMASPLLKALRRAYPEAHIAWLADPALADLLRSNPDLNEVICWSKNAWNKLRKEHKYPTLVREIMNFTRGLRQGRFDLVLDCQGLLRSRILCWLSGARQRIGFESKEPGRFLMTKMISRGPDSKMISSEYRYMAQQLGVDPGEFQPYLHLAEADHLAARNKLQEVGIKDRFLLFAPFTTRPQKHWFNERWIALGQRLTKETGLKVVLLGAPADKPEAARIAAGIGNDCIDLAGQLSLPQSSAVLSQAALVIGVDTGLTHMGTAFKRPTLALFGATCPYLETPWPGTRVLYHKLECSPCKRSPTCDNRFDCMLALTVDDVFAEATALLAKDF